MIRFLPASIAFMLWGGLQAIAATPQVLWSVCIALAAALIVSLALLTKRSVRESYPWHFLLVPFFLVSGTLLFALFPDRAFIVQAMTAIAALLLWFYFESVFRFFHRPAAYQAYTLENISPYLNILSSFLLMAGFFALHVLLSISATLLTLLVFLASFGMMYQTLWSQKVDRPTTLRFALSSGVVVAECFWAVLYLPTSYLVNGLVIASVFFITMNLIRFSVTLQLTRRRAVRTVALGLAVIVLSLGTAQWI